MTPEHVALDLAKRAFRTDTAHRLVEHLVMCRCVAAIAGPEGQEAAEDTIAFDPAGAAAAASLEFGQLDPAVADKLVTLQQERVCSSLLLTCSALVATYTHLGGAREDARGLDPEHVALVGALALLSGADELYVPPEPDGEAA